MKEREVLDAEVWFDMIFSPNVVHQKLAMDFPMLLVGYHGL